MLLAMDVGNTNIMIGLFQGEKLPHHWRVSTRPERTADEFSVMMRGLLVAEGLDLDVIEAAAIANVVPDLGLALGRFCERYLDVAPLWVGPGVRTGMDIRYEEPREVGADRIVNGVAALHRYGAPVVVVDFGTATTFDVISARGSYMGGAISPGVGISMEALFAHAARLPRVDLVKPPSVIGKNTVHSMQAGLVYGFAGQVDALVDRIIQQMSPPRPRVVATGGLARVVAPECRTVEIIDPLLTLEGLRLVYERNRRDPDPGQKGADNDGPAGAG